jgi:transcriptional regulator with XRE-family HTH domain
MPKPTALQRSIAKKVHAARKAHGWSKARLATELHYPGASAALIAQIENPTYTEYLAYDVIQCLAHICAVLGLSYADVCQLSTRKD